MHEYKINETSTLYFLGHASFKIKTNGKTIYMDPYEINDTEKADIVLITHPHYDHLSISDLQKIVTPNTIILGTIDCTSKLAGKVNSKYEIISPEMKKKLNGIDIEIVAAYNTDKRFHPKENGWVGYIITIDGVRIYHAGDTDIIPEMSNIKTDIAMLPIGGTYTMDAKDAAKSCEIIKPKIAIPMHYNKIVGSIESGHEFKRLAKSCEVLIL